MVADFNVLVDGETLLAAQRLAWVDVINAADWLLVVLVLEVEVRLQLRGYLSDSIMSAARSSSWSSTRYCSCAPPIGPMQARSSISMMRRCGCSPSFLSSSTCSSGSTKRFPLRLRPDSPAAVSPPKISAACAGTRPPVRWKWSTRPCCLTACCGATGVRWGLLPRDQRHAGAGLLIGITAAFGLAQALAIDASTQNLQRASAACWQPDPPRSTCAGPGGHGRGRVRSPCAAPGGKRPGKSPAAARRGYCQLRLLASGLACCWR